MPTFQVFVIQELVGEYDAKDAAEARTIAENRFSEYRDFFDTTSHEVLNVERITHD